MNVLKKKWYDMIWLWKKHAIEFNKLMNAFIYTTINCSVGCDNRNN